MHKRKIFGLSAAMITPFDKDGHPDSVRAIQHAKDLLAAGCDSLTLFGTTGEGFGLSMRERRDLFAALIEALPSDTVIHAGVLSPSIDGAVEMATAAYEQGASNLLLSPPFFMKNVDDQGLFAWFSAVFDKIGGQLSRVILYNIPGQTAVPLSSDLVSRLRRDYPGIITGIKDSSGDWESTRRYLSAHGDIAILVGDERQLPRAMAEGGEGSICGLANFAPDLLRHIIHQGGDGALITKIVELILKYPALPALKVLTAHTSKDPQLMRVRPPLTPLADHVLKKLVSEFDALMAAERREDTPIHIA